MEGINNKIKLNELLQASSLRSLELGVSDVSSAELVKMHLQKLRPNRLREFNLAVLAKQTLNFSGAEIEQAIIDAMHQAFSHPNKRFSSVSNPQRQ